MFAFIVHEGTAIFNQPMPLDHRSITLLDADRINDFLNYKHDSMLDEHGDQDSE